MARSWRLKRAIWTAHGGWWIIGSSFSSLVKSAKKSVNDALNDPLQDVWIFLSPWVQLKAIQSEESGDKEKSTPKCATNSWATWFACIRRNLVSCSHVNKWLTTRVIWFRLGPMWRKKLVRGGLPGNFSFSIRRLLLVVVVVLVTNLESGDRRYFAEPPHQRMKWNGRDKLNY